MAAVDMRLVHVAAFTAFGASVSAFAACLPGSHCSEGYDDRIVTTYACEGNVRVGHSTSCGKSWDQQPLDCTTKHQVCLAELSDCATPCTTDAECTSFEYCGASMSDGGSDAMYCKRRIYKRGICTNDPTHCEPGTSCVPDAILTPDASASRDAANLTDAANDAASAATVMTCQ